MTSRSWSPGRTGRSRTPSASPTRSSSAGSAEATGLSEMDAYQLVTQASRSPIANVCDANYTIVAKMPKRYLPAADWMGGIHPRLRDIGTRCVPVGRRRRPGGPVT